VKCHMLVQMNFIIGSLTINYLDREQTEQVIIENPNLSR
jgi:hypothetical protein